MKSRNANYFACAALAILPGVLSCGCGKSAADNAAGGAPPALAVQVQAARTESIADTTEFLSVLKSRHSAAINPQVEGQVTKIFVKSGDHVKAGTALLQIDPLKQFAAVNSQEASRVAQEANVRNAKAQLARERQLVEAGVVSKQEFDNAQTNYDAAAAQLNSLSAQVSQQQAELHYYRVTSPMDGIVGDIPVRTGDRVGVATLLTTVDEPGALEAYIYVPAERARDLKAGLPVRLVDSADHIIADTRVSFVSSEVDPETQTVLAKAAIANPRGELRAAQQARALITWGIHEGAVIPVLAVLRINGQFFAFIAVSDGKATVARQKLIRVGDTIGNDYAVLDGLKAGDHIIVSGTQFLRDGAPVMEQMHSDGGGGSR